MTEGGPHGRELFVYYRVASAAAGEAHAAATAMQSALRTAHAGLQARLLRRDNGPADAETWMETYALPSSPGGVGAVLQAAIEAAAAAALAVCIDGARHVEAFEVAVRP